LNQNCIWLLDAIGLHFFKVFEERSARYTLEDYKDWYGEAYELHKIRVEKNNICMKQVYVNSPELNYGELLGAA
jgi:hypothetical protein